MSKKIFALLSLMTGMSSAFSTGFYIVPTIEYQGISAKGIGYEAIVPRLAAGVGGGLNNTQFYMAGEVFGNLRGIRVHQNKSGDETLNTKYSVGGSFIPGIYLDDVVLGYLRFGVIDTKFDDLDVSRTGYQLGVGLQAILTPCWDMRGEYVYTKYRGLADYGTPRGDEFALGMVYRFA